MPHARDQILDAFKAALLDETTAEDRVGFSVYPEPEVPAIRIFMGAEAIPENLQTMDNTKYYRTLEVFVEARVQDDKAVLQATLNSLCAEIEANIEADDTLGGLVVCAAYTGMVPGFEEVSAMPVGLAVMSYSVEFRTLTTDPNTIIS